MDLTARLLGVAAARPHALPVPAPGGTAARLAVERELRRRAWPLATSPAQAGLLVVCGTPGRRLAEAAEVVWRQMPSPRARAEVATDAEVAAALDAARLRLRDAAGQRADLAARARLQRPGPSDEELPAGLPMAERAPDRDGLTLDQLHLRLGPVLPDWPAGLVLHATVQGDVVQEASVEVLDAAPGGVEPFWDTPWRRAMAGERVSVGEAARRRAACHLDSLARLLGVAGWDGAALVSRGLRDDLLAGGPASKVTGRFARFERRVGRSRLLRWLTRGAGAFAPGAARTDDVGGVASRGGEDVAGRWLRWLEETSAALTRLDSSEPLARDQCRQGPRGALDQGVPPSRALLDALPELVVGAELATARLVVASLDPDADELAPVQESVGG
ncbi:MAG TPA: hypothetical protein VE776_06110 [Actinomycetota bacterium]|jgi:hypothetical protein|nr:hypothetical protein [Actinomycetota bacterium]